MLVEANLSATSITEIINAAFSDCGSLQTVSLPSSLEHIGHFAFNNCVCLVTVIVSLGSQPIEIGGQSFDCCRALANIVLPPGSTAAPIPFYSYQPFSECTLILDRFGGQPDSIVDCLIHRFDNYPAHKICYDHSSTTVQEAQECIQRTMENNVPLVDDFGMTPLHVLFSTPEPSHGLLQVLLDKYPYHVLECQDANGKRPLDYLLSNWTETNSPLL